MSKKEYRVTLTFDFTIEADTDMEALVIAESMVGNDPERYCQYDIECMGAVNEKR